MNWMTKIYLRMISHRPDEDEGATMVEYGLMVALVAAVSITVVGFLGGEVTGAFQKVVTAFPE